YSADREEIGDSLLWWPHGTKDPEIISTPNEFVIDFGKRPLIFKIHGSVRHDTEAWDSFVITEDDYVDFLARMVESTAIPPTFYAYFRGKNFLFLGYSLSDWNLRVILRHLSRPLGSRGGRAKELLRSWAIQLDATELDKLLWRMRNVLIF